MGRPDCLAAELLAVASSFPAAALIRADLETDWIKVVDFESELFPANKSWQTQQFGLYISIKH